MARLETTNVMAAVVAIAVLLALMSPLADPERVSVDSQVQALLSGSIKPEAFDYELLADRSGRFGREALARLARAPNIQIASRAKGALAPAQRPVALTDADLAARIKVYPAGASLPQGILGVASASKPAEPSLPACLRGTGDCVAYLIDLNGDGRPEVILTERVEGSYLLPASVVLQQSEAGTWSVAASLYPACPGMAELLERGKVGTARHPLDDIIVDGVQFGFSAQPNCPSKANSANAPPARAGQVENERFN
jgi:hypothetical protein